MTTVASAPSTGRRAVQPAASRARVDEAVRLGALATLWLGLLLVTYWWTTGGGVQDLTSWTDGLLFALGGPIYAGTNEIQRNIIAERLLGLPREKNK